ncbi:MAG: MFS transporter [Oscillospiraceae bacterium]|nr:MFS transporter [Oscillospiraceae bacterium]
MIKNNKNPIKYACYMVNISMSVVAALSPLLFLTFRSLYSISFSMLGALVFLNFCTQLTVDLILSFYAQKFNIPKLIKVIPVLTAAGLFIYAVFPFVFPGHTYTGLVIGTLIFSASGGLAEALISPVIAALPAQNPQKEMSKLHSVYAWGVVAVVVISTLLLQLLGRENWQWVAILWIAVPLISFCLFLNSAVPLLQMPQNAAHVFSLIKQKDFLVCFVCIFLSGISEGTMSQWSSGYMEQALHIPKVWGDIFGVAMFAVMLGIGRTCYAKYGKDIYKALALGAAGTTLCYLVATVTNTPLVGLISCVMTGLCVAMLWPGSLIVAADKFPAGGVAVFALMAAGGDLGGAVGPQLVGTVTDIALSWDFLRPLSAAFCITAEQCAMKIGLLAAIPFPLLAAVLYFKLYKKQTHPAALTAKQP